MEGLVCPKCDEKTAECFHDGDVGVGTRYLDQYRLECQSCDHKETKTVDGGEMGWNEALTTCPFCGKE